MLDWVAILPEVFRHIGLYWVKVLSQSEFYKVPQYRLAI
jgi:hypothetical protein